MSLSGKVALVTGAGSGLGKASAIQLAKNGADLILWGRTESKLAETAEELIGMGRKCRWYSVDVNRTSDIPYAVQKARK